MTIALNFFEEISANTVILTPNRRLSATLHKYYQQYQIKNDNKLWETPTIFPITTWINKIWADYTHKEFSPSPQLLNTAQEQFLWETIILQNKAHEQLLQITETAELARSAWTLIKQWEVNIDDPAFKASDDYLAFLQWIIEFQRMCNDNNWIDSASLTHEIIKKIESRQITLPPAIMTYGFTEYSPELKKLFSGCEKVGCNVSTLKVVSQTANPSRIGFAENQLELQTIAQYVKSIHEVEPDKMIGCVIPNLDSMRDRVHQIFSEVFGNSEITFNISAGKKLAQTPIIHAALQILSLHKKSVSLETLSYLLTSPFIGDAEIERIRRADYEYQLRFNNKNIVHLDTVSSNKNCTRFANRILKVISLMNNKLEKSTHAAWASYFCEILTAMGWPGERSLNSEEYQIVESWLNLLDEFNTLDQVAKPVTYSQAIHMLRKMAANKVFKAKSPDAPIQILGLLEAAGIPFDYLWVSGMDDISWPPQPKPNPFIPRRIQRDLQMPHATAERELSFCNTLTQQFRESASHIIFSYAEKKDELELHASPLIRNFNEINIQDLHLKDYISTANKIFLSREIETITDDVAPAVMTDEKIHGGVSVIRDQALCPFKSFSSWRLHAHPMEKPLPGLRAKDRGTVIHKSLELIWNEIKNQEGLLALDDEKLNKIIHDSIVTALLKITDSHGEFRHYINLEKNRLQKLLLEWLHIEKQRPPFTLMTNEKAMQFTLGPLALSIRIDRIDQLADGSRFIIDYKTGKNNDIGKWFSDRPEEPQLPLYALLDMTNISGITFAQVYTGEHGFKGISHYAMDIQGIKVISEIKKSSALSWQEQLAQWKNVLTKLGTDFYHGVASVDPKDPSETCTWCELKPLCRINESHDEIQTEQVKA